MKNGAGAGKSSTYNNEQCFFFDAYMLEKAGKPWGTYCSLFAQAYAPTTATYVPGWLGGEFYGVAMTWSWSLQ